MKGAVAYKSLDDRIILETENIRAIMNVRPAAGFTGFEYKPLNRYIGGWFVMAVETGYPFPAEGGEWSRLTPDIEIENFDDYTDVRLVGDFQERTGLRQTLIYRLHSGSNLIETISKLENVGRSKITNLGLRNIGWFGGVFDQGSYHSEDKSIVWTQLTGVVGDSCQNLQRNTMSHGLQCTVIKRGCSLVTYGMLNMQKTLDL